MALNHPAMLAVLAFTALQAEIAWANALNVQQQGDISYVSGGIGKDESDALQTMQHSYNFRVMNADQSGHFFGDTRITISDMNHHVLLDTTSGPLFYANLPKGRYVVEAFNQAESKKQTVAINGSKPVRVHFVWSEDITQITNY